MRKAICVLLCSLLGLAYGGIPVPVHVWDFEHRTPSGYFYDAIKGSGGKSDYLSGTAVPGGGMGGSSGLVCRGKGSPQGHVPLDFREYSIQFSFKLTEPFVAGKSRGLFNYEFWSYRRSFRVRIDGKGRLETRFVVRHDTRSPFDYRLHSLPIDWQAGEWHTVHLAGKKGGALNLWLDGQLVASGQQAPGLCDINDGKKREYNHLVRLGWDTTEPQLGHGSLEGVMDNVQLWDRYVKPSELSQRQLPQRLTRHVVIGRGKEYRTCPFNVPDRKGQAYGSFNKAEQQFIDAAATASLTLEGSSLVVRFYCPIPSGFKVSTGGKSIWSGDHVEFFLRPHSKSSVYYQYCAGSNGLFKAFRYTSYLVEDKTFKSRSTCHVDTHHPTQFKVTITIPLSEVECSGIQDGACMTGNFCRGGKTAGGLTSWAPMRGDFHIVDSFGKFMVGSVGSYFANQASTLQGEMEGLSGQEDMRRELERDLRSFEVKNREHGDDVEYYDRLEMDLGNLRTQLVSYRLLGKPYLIWQNNPWGNDIVPTMHSKAVRSIRLKAAQNSRVLYGMAFSNLTSNPFLGIVKCFQQWPPLSRNKSIYCDNWSDFQSNIRILEGVMLLNSGGQPMYDPMIPLAQGNILRVPAHSNTPLWLSISTKGLKPGTYRCCLVFKPSYGYFPVETIPVELEVLPVDLGKVELDSFHYAFFTEYPVDMASYRHIDRLYRYLVEQEANVMFAGHLREVYPAQNPDGTLHPIDFSRLDKKVETYVRAGMPLRRLKLMFNLHTFIFCRWDADGKVHAPTLKYGTPEFERGFKEFIRQLYAHLESRFQMSPERVIIYTGDEPEGDIHDPKSRLYRVNYLGRLVRTAVPRASTVTNPVPRHGVNKGFLEAIDILSKYHSHLIVLVRARNQAVRELLKKKNYVLWNYDVYVNTVASEIYRQMFYTSFRDGFGSANAYWAIDSYAGDGFDQNDFSGDYRGGYSKNRTDYGSAYADGNLGTIATGRRSEAHYQGLLDYKAMTLCKRLLEKKKDQAKWQKRLDDIVAMGCHGTCIELDSCHQKLLGLIMELQQSQAESASSEASLRMNRERREYGPGEQVIVTVQLPPAKPGEYRLRFRKQVLLSSPKHPSPWIVTFKADDKPGYHGVFLDRKDAKTGDYKKIGDLRYWVSPEQLTPGQARPEDFREFWEGILGKERQRPLEVKRTLLPTYSTASRKVYSVSMNAPLGRIYGFLNVPCKAGRLPAKMTVCWAGAGWSQPAYFSDEFVILAMNIHTFDPRNQQAGYEALCQPLRQRYKCRETYMYKGLPKRDEMYYIHGIAGNVRALEWLSSLPEVNPKRIGYFGTSQGGAFGFYLGGLSDRLSHIVCDVPALCDVSAYVHGRSSGFPWYSVRAGKTAEIRQVCAYFDCASFAPDIKASIRVLGGEFDEVCYPYNVRVAFNGLPARSDRQFFTQWGGDHGRNKTLYGEQLRWLDEALRK